MLFLSSYIPLFLILAFLGRGIKHSIFGISTQFLSMSFVAISIISFIFLLLAVRLQSRSGADFKKVEEYRRRNDQITSYLLIYIMPFLGIDVFEFEGAVIFTFFFLIIAVIQIRSAQLHINPVLAFLGYDIYRVKFEREVTLVVSNREIEEALIRRDDEESGGVEQLFLKVADLGQGVYITSDNVNSN